MNVAGTTTVYGVIGDPIGHTLSPRMQNRAIEAMGIDAVYVPFRVSPDEVGNAVRAVRALSIGGLNVTVPHKTAVIPFLDRLTDAARTIGAVNTILRDGDDLVGENTDVYGFIRCVTVDGGVERFPDTVCVLGAGGAARGVVYACATRPEVREIIVVNRTFARAEEIAVRFAGVGTARITACPDDPASMRRIVPGAGMIVNTTTLGMKPDVESTPLSEPGLIHPDQIVCDIIYTPARTKLLRDAEAQGAHTVGGLAMLAAQGARSLSLWTGRDAPVGVMMDELRRAINENE